MYGNAERKLFEFLRCAYKYKFNSYIEGEMEKMIDEFMNDSNEVVEGQQDILISNLQRFSAKQMSESYERIWDKLMSEGRR